ncbi:MAG TPA: M23 family metallopeptidase [Clostridiales bacterium]|nr:M23 family metallopeptidase [Clostridiales bacterium]
MDDVIVRSRYSRNNPTYRKRKSRVKENNRLGEIIKIQILVSILIFLIIWGISKIDATITQFITTNAKWVLSSDMDINNIYNQINSMFNIDNGEIEKEKENEKGNEKESEDSEKTITDSAYIENTTGNNKSLELEFIVPVEGVVSSFFGERLDPVTNKLKYHSGIDIETGIDTQIKAVEAGEAIEISEHRMYGRYIKLKHSGGITTVYAHCSKILIKEGTKVSKGDIIAEVGSTGVSTGSHLHFEIWKDERPQNPLEFINVPIITTNSNEIL